MPHPLLFRKHTRSMQQKLMAVPGLTFFKDYRGNGTSLDADFAVGSITATYTAARAADAPSTYVDSAGVVQLLTTADVRRRQGGYYDETGFHVQSGEMIEAAGTNMLLTTYFDTSSSWRKVATATITKQDTTYTNPYTVATKIFKFISAAQNDGMQTELTKKPSFTAGTVYTISALVRGTGTAKTYFKKDSNAAQYGTTINTLDPNKWTLITGTETAGAPDENGNVGVVSDDATSTVYIAYVQCEVSPYATSFIPTTTAVLTRAKDGTTGLNYASAGNRTNAAETIFIKYAPSWAAASQANAVYLHDSDADIIDTAFVVASDSFQYRPNGTDDNANVALAAFDPAINTSYVMAMVSYGATAATNAEIYVDGISKGTTTTNYTEPEIGTNFYIGSKADASLQISGVIQSVCFFSRALTAAEVLQVTNILNSGSL